MTTYTYTLTVTNRKDDTTEILYTFETSGKKVFETWDAHLAKFESLRSEVKAIAANYDKATYIVSGDHRRTK